MFLVPPPYAPPPPPMGSQNSLLSRGSLRKYQKAPASENSTMDKKEAKKKRKSNKVARV